MAVTWLTLGSHVFAFLTPVVCASLFFVFVSLPPPLVRKWDYSSSSSTGHLGRRRNADPGWFPVLIWERVGFTLLPISPRVSYVPVHLKADLL